MRRWSDHGVYVASHSATPFCDFAVFFDEFGFCSVPVSPI